MEDIQRLELTWIRWTTFLTS